MLNSTLGKKKPKPTTKNHTKTHINLLIKLKGKLNTCAPGTLNAKGMQSLSPKIMEKFRQPLTPISL